MKKGNRKFTLRTDEVNVFIPPFLHICPYKTIQIQSLIGHQSALFTLEPQLLDLPTSHCPAPLVHFSHLLPSTKTSSLLLPYDPFLPFPWNNFLPRNTHELLSFIVPMCILPTHILTRWIIALGFLDRVHDRTICGGWRTRRGASRCAGLQVVSRGQKRGV